MSLKDPLRRVLPSYNDFHRAKIVRLVSVALLFIVLTAALTARTHNVKSRIPFSTPSDKLKGETSYSFDTVSYDLHLLVAATEPNAELCKGLISANVLGYETPTLINWGREFHSDTLRFNGSHIGKIHGSLDYLNTLDEQKVLEHLVLLIDGYDLWFQLPASVLHKRFRSVGKELFNLTVERYGTRAVLEEQMSQEIILPAEKNCGPGAGQVDQVACYGQPESPLRKDLYGAQTDVRDDRTHLPLHNRPAFLNSGFILGRTNQVKTLLRRAKAKSERDEAHGGSDQRIYNEIFGEQEYWRETQRQEHRSFYRKGSDMVKSVLGTSASLITDPHPSHKPPNMTAANGPFEFGLGLDYNLELSQSAVLSEFDGRFITFGDLPGKHGVLTEPGLPVPPRARDLPEDIATQDTLPGVDFAQEPLYVNVYTGSVPITVHMNGIKNMRQGLWPNMWFLKLVREKLRASKSFVIARTDKGQDLKWSEICGEYERELLPPINV